MQGGNSYMSRRLSQETKIILGNVTENLNCALKVWIQPSLKEALELEIMGFKLRSQETSSTGSSLVHQLLD